MTTVTALSQRTDRLSHLPAYSIGVLAVVVRLAVAAYTHSIGEDALITLRYAEHIAAGHGFVYNLGQKVLGSTTPLYTLLLAFFASLHCDALALGKATNILAEGATCVLLARLMARPEIGKRQAGLFAALLYAVTSTPISVAIGGMETGLVTCVGLAMITAYVAGNSRMLYLLGGILYLLRIDGLLLFGVLAIGLAVRQRRVAWQDLVCTAVIALPWTLFATFYFGSPIPNTLIAKVTAYGGGGLLNLLHPTAVNREAFQTQFVTGALQKILSLLALAGIGTLWFAQRRTFTKPAQTEEPPVANPGLLLVPTVWMLLYFLTMLTSRVPAFGWYFLPPWPVVVILAAIGADAAIHRLGGRKPATFVPLAWALLLTGTSALGVWHLPAISSEIAKRQQEDDDLRLPIGVWLKHNGQSNERVLLEPIGYIGYYSRLPILDSVGLVSPEVLPSYRAPNPLADMITRLRPEWLCLRDWEAAQLHPKGNTIADGGYLLVQSFQGKTATTVFNLYHRRDLEPGTHILSMAR